MKIDTDGFDCPIVAGSIDLWARSGAVIFFEYDPDYYPGWNPLPMWDALAGIGYSSGVVLENTGEYAFTMSLAHRGGLEDLHARYAGRAHERYADIAFSPPPPRARRRPRREVPGGRTAGSDGLAGSPYPEWIGASHT